MKEGEGVAETLGAEWFPTERLLLDGRNPRLPEDLQNAGQRELLRYMEEMYDLDEIGYSMARQGYFEEEPLLTVADDGGQRIVVEGNRRLATLKLLTDRAARAAVGDKPLWSELAAEVEQQGHDISVVPTRLYSSRQELLEYLGFRHVSGLMQWTPEAKARYVYRLVVDHGYSFYEAGRAIGSRRDAIRRQFVAYAALLQARDAEIDITPAMNRFGVYYRALQNPGIRTFLRLSGWTDAEPDDTRPLEDEGPARMGELIDWIFQSRAVRDSRQLDTLGSVVQDEAALALLRDTKDLQSATEELPGDRQAVIAALRLAHRNVGRAYAEIHEFPEDEDILAEVERLSRLLDRLMATLRSGSGS